jgi:hypothetical protein
MLPVLEDLGEKLPVTNACLQFHKPVFKEGKKTCFSSHYYEGRLFLFLDRRESVRNACEGT